MRAAFFLLVAVLTLSTAGSLSPTPRTTVASGCDPDLEYRNYVAQEAGRVASDPGTAAQERRDSLGIPTLTWAEDAVAIASDSLCALAAAAINVHLQLPSTTRRSVFLVGVGPKYWAEDAALHVAGHPLVFILDSALTQVTAETSRY